MHQQLRFLNMPALLSDSDGADDVVVSRGTNVTDLTVASNDDAQQQSK